MSGQDDYWSDYNRGAAGLPPRNGMYYTWGEQAGRDSTFSNGNANAGPAGSGMAALMLLAFALAAIVAIAAGAAVSAVLAVPAAYLLIAVTALLARGRRLGFTDAYKTSFIGLLITAVAGAVLAFCVLQGWLPVAAVALPVAALVNWLLDGAQGLGGLQAGDAGTLALGATLLLAPGVLAFVVVLNRRIGAPYTGGLGLLRAVAASLAVLVLPMIGFGAAAAFAAAYGEPAIGANEIDTYLMITLALVGVMAIAGGLVLGLALMALGGGLAKGGPLFRTAWFTGAVAMAITGGAAAVAILLFRDGDAMLQALIAFSGPGRASPPSFAQALPGFLKLTAPGALAGAFFVAGSLYAYRGLGGWLKAIAISAPLCLAVLCGAVMALAQLR